MNSGWWLKDGCWLCKRCAHMNVGSNKHCFGCDLKAPDVTDGNEEKFFAAPNWMEMSRTDGKQYDNKWKRDRIMAESGGPSEPEDVKGLPLIASREFSKQEGLFGGNFCWDERAVDPYVLQNRKQREQRIEHFKKVLQDEGITEMPDESKFSGINAALVTRCKERIVRCMQRKAREQLEGKKQEGYLQRWRRNYAQSGWWCDTCDYFTFFPHSECHECRAPRPAPSELWKFAYRKNERETAILNVERSLREDEEEQTNYFVGKGRYARAIAPDWLDERTGVRRNNDQTEIGRRTRYYMNRQDDLATESQKLAAYNMMVFMTQGAVGSNSGLAGIPVDEDGNALPEEESVLAEVQEEIEREDEEARKERAAEVAKSQEESAARAEARESDDWLDKLTSAPLMDQNNQFLSFDDKLAVYKKLFEELEELQKESAELDDSDDEEEKKEKENAARILAAKKRKEEDFRAHLAFLHHEDFILQLGEEIDSRNARQEEGIKTEPVDDEPVRFGKMRNRFAEELENLVPDAIIDLCGEEEKEEEDEDEDFYDPKRDRHAKGRYTIPARRGEMPGDKEYKEEDEELEEKKRRKKKKAPAGIPEKQWRGKSDLDKLREKYRERNLAEAADRVADSTNCVRDDGEVDSDGEDVNTMIERIKVQSITMANMSKHEILAMNDELYKLSDRASDPFSGRSKRRRDGLYFDHMGRRRYKSPERRGDRDRDRDRRDDRDRGYSSDRRDSRERRDSRGYKRDEYDKTKYAKSDYRRDGTARWVRQISSVRTASKENLKITQMLHFETHFSLKQR